MRKATIDQISGSGIPALFRSHCVVLSLRLYGVTTSAVSGTTLGKFRPPACHYYVRQRGQPPGAFRRGNATSILIVAGQRPRFQVGRTLTPCRASTLWIVASESLRSCKRRSSFRSRFTPSRRSRAHRPASPSCSYRRSHLRRVGRETPKRRQTAPASPSTRYAMIQPRRWRSVRSSSSIN
jgi:hypothetical protein